jgi:hypothetical protein
MFVSFRPLCRSRRAPIDATFRRFFEAFWPHPQGEVQRAKAGIGSANTGVFSLPSRTSGRLDCEL